MKCVLDFLFFSMIETIEPHVHIRKRVLLIYLLQVEMILPKKEEKKVDRYFCMTKKKHMYKCLKPKNNHTENKRRTYCIETKNKTIDIREAETLYSRQSSRSHLDSISSPSTARNPISHLTVSVTVIDQRRLVAAKFVHSE